jgi:hypothetical protein
MLPVRRRPPPRSINPRRSFSARVANKLSDRPQNLIRQLGVRLSDRARGGDPTDHRRHDRDGALPFIRLAGNGPEATFDQRNSLLEPLRVALADYFFLPRDFAGGSRHRAAPCQVVAMLEGQVIINESSYGSGLAGPVRRQLLHAWFEAGREGFRCQRPFGGKLGVKRTMRQSGALTDFRDADTINATLAKQAPRGSHQRFAILGDPFLSDFQRRTSQKRST